MGDILFINSCIRPKSRTYLLAQEVLKKLPGQVTELKLCEENLNPLDSALLEKRNRLISLGNFQGPLFKYARQFSQADEILMAAPYWDLAFPSLMKVYLEQVCITGITFQYTKEGIPQGLCRAKHLIYVTTSGGPIYQNLGFDYVKSLAENFWGIQNPVFFSAQNLDIIGADVDKIMQKAIEKIRNFSYE